MLGGAWPAPACVLGGAWPAPACVLGGAWPAPACSVPRSRALNVCSMCLGCLPLSRPCSLPLLLVCMLWQARRVMELDVTTRLLLLTFGMRHTMAGVCPARVSSVAHGGCAGLLYAARKDQPTMQMSTVDVSHVHVMSDTRIASCGASPFTRLGMRLPVHVSHPRCTHHKLWSSTLHTH